MPTRYRRGTDAVPTRYWHNANGSFEVLLGPRRVVRCVCAFVRVRAMSVRIALCVCVRVHRFVCACVYVSSDCVWFRGRSCLRTRLRPSVRVRLSVRVCVPL